jgi:pyridoxamine 5'-phosphate oxidase
MNIKTGLSEKTVDPDPFKQFDIWFKERLDTGVYNPNAVNLGTAGKDKHVSVRTVLLKGYDDSGFVFFTNYNSKKGSQLKSNHFAALHFYWPESDRQIRIEGTVIKVSPAESDLYFQTRPAESRISAWASEQSAIIPDREFIENRFARFSKMFENKQIERPEHWGGYRISPTWFEFWEDGEFRLHDRITYTLSGREWRIARLSP